jgi:hypothetical protein
MCSKTESYKQLLIILQAIFVGSNKTYVRTCTNKYEKKDECTRNLINFDFKSNFLFSASK